MRAPVLAFAMAMLSACQPTTPEDCRAAGEILQEKDSQTALTVKAGEHIRVSLPTGGMVGYNWSVTELDTSVVKLDRTVDCSVPSPNVFVTDGMGSELWVFTAVAPGRTVLRMDPQGREPVDGGSTDAGGGDGDAGVQVAPDEFVLDITVQ